MATGIAVIGLASGLYLSAYLGAGAAGRLDDRYPPSHRMARGRDPGRLEGSTLLGGRVGVGTALFALVIGPAVAGGLRLVRWFPGRG